MTEVKKKKPTGLVPAIIEVMKSVKGMEKNSMVGSGRSAYNGTKDQDVKEVFNKALSDNGLCILPIDIEEETEISRWEEEDPYSKSNPKAMKQKQSVFTKVKVKYLLMHESGESQQIMGYGHGVDPQDKGAGKATTYSLKNLLLYTFLTPVGKIDDTDTTHSNDIQATPKVIKLTELIPDTENWKNVINAMTNGYTIEQIKTKYSMSNENQTKLIDEIGNTI